MGGKGGLLCHFAIKKSDHTWVQGLSDPKKVWPVDNFGLEQPEIQMENSILEFSNLLGKKKAVKAVNNASKRLQLFSTLLPHAYQTFNFFGSSL